MGQVVSTLKDPIQDIDFLGIQKRPQEAPNKLPESKKSYSSSILSNNQNNRSFNPKGGTSGRTPKRTGLSPSLSEEFVDNKRPQKTKERVEMRHIYLQTLTRERIYSNSSTEKEIKDESSALKKQILSLRRVVQGLNQTICQLRYVNGGLNQKINDLTNENRELNKTVNILKNENEELYVKIDNLQKESTDSAVRNEEIMKKLQEKCDSVEAQLEEFKNSIAEKRAREATRDLEMTHYKSRNKLLKSKLAHMTDTLRQKDFDIEYLNSQKNQLQSEKSSLSESVCKFEEESSAKTDVINSQSTMIDDLQNEVDRFQNESSPRGVQDEGQLESLKKKIQDLTTLLMRTNSEKQKLANKVEETKAAANLKYELNYKMKVWNLQEEMLKFNQYKRNANKRFDLQNREIVSLNSRFVEMRDELKSANESLKGKEKEVAHLTRHLKDEVLKTRMEQEKTDTISKLLEEKELEIVHLKKHLTRELQKARILQANNDEMNELIRARDKDIGDLTIQLEEEFLKNRHEQSQKEKIRKLREALRRRISQCHVLQTKNDSLEKSRNWYLRNYERLRHDLREKDILNDCLRYEIMAGNAGTSSKNNAND